jgi:hypothetical protein
LLSHWLAVLCILGWHWLPALGADLHDANSVASNHRKSSAIIIARAGNMKAVASGSQHIEIEITECCARCLISVGAVGDGTSYFMAGHNRQLYKDGRRVSSNGGAGHRADAPPLRPGDIIRVSASFLEQLGGIVEFTVNGVEAGTIVGVTGLLQFAARLRGGRNGEVSAVRAR